ncbi:prepilin peptidase [Vagococcus vulneris]|uniref:Prepilin peptidase n=1 Tax=Vagococcus vulneris TaxID=1977869 RepID=A0A430A0H6_9ENTE|nr:A24 family peptidase [Vagococcus vulneris]RST99837.1 hypothetical protein CBF37_03695 [Vagococcus vulneris]
MIILVFYLGCILGSFLGVLAERIPINESFTMNRSICRSCKHTLSPLDLIPLYLFLFHQNRCAHCASKIPRYLSFFELIVGSCCLIFYYVKWDFSAYHQLILGILLILCLILSLTDYLYGIAEPKILYSFSIILLICLLFTAPYLLHPLTALILFIAFQLIHWLMPNSLGGGDSKLITVLGLFIGGYQIIWVIFFASFSGLIFILCFNFLSKSQIIRLPFIPFITLGYMLSIIFIQ